MLTSCIWFAIRSLFSNVQINDLTGAIPAQLYHGPEHFQQLLLLGGGNLYCPLTNYSTWSVITDYTPFAVTCDPANGAQTLAIILGIVIPVAVVVLLVIIFLVYYKKTHHEGAWSELDERK